MKDTSFGIYAMEAILTLNTGGERFVACDELPYCCVGSFESGERVIAGE